MVTQPSRLMVLAAFAPLFAQAQDEAIIFGIPNRVEVNQDITRGGRPGQDGIKELAAEQFRAILDLENDASEVKEEKRRAEALEFSFISNPMSWFTSPSDEQVDEILKVLQDPANHPVFIHCQHGRDRTGLIMGLYRVFVDGWTPEAAYKEMLDLGFRPILFGLDNYFRHRTGYWDNPPQSQIVQNTLDSD